MNNFNINETKVKEILYSSLQRSSLDDLTKHSILMELDNFIDMLKKQGITLSVGDKVDGCEVKRVIYDEVLGEYHLVLGSSDSTITDTHTIEPRRLHL